MLKNHGEACGVAGMTKVMRKGGVEIGQRLITGMFPQLKMFIIKKKQANGYGFNGSIIKSSCYLFSSQRYRYIHIQQLAWNFFANLCFYNRLCYNKCSDDYLFSEF